MKGKRTILGYQKGLTKLLTSATMTWFEPSSFLVATGDAMPEEEKHKPHYVVVKALMMCACLVLVFRLTNLQVAQQAQNRWLAEGNRLRQQVSVAPRGAIVDRQGSTLVLNEPGYSLDLIPSDLPKQKDARQKIYMALAQELSLSSEVISGQVERAGLASLDPVILQPNLARDQALIYKIKFTETPGVRVSFMPTRKYNTAPGLSHILGYTARMTEQDMKKHQDYPAASPIGRAGLEASYDSNLRGREGVSEVEVNANGQLQRVTYNTPPQVGDTLHLTLDEGLQTETGAALKEAMEKNGAKQASAIALNPQTGGILTSLSLPGYDNNDFAKGISGEAYKVLSNHPDKPLLNRAVNGLYPSGSAIKPFVAIAALQEGTIKPNTMLDTSVGKIKIGQWEFPDWKVHGATDVRQAIAESNDIFFYALGGGWDKIPGLGVDRLEKYFRLFGFGQETGLDYTNDTQGLVPTPGWKQKVKKESWYIGDTYHISIGQGDLLVTPLQLVRALSSLVNGGKLVTQHVVDSIESSDTKRQQKLTFPEQKLPFSSDVLQTVQEGMKRTVASDTGSGRALRSLPFSSGGKTGTAQFGSEEKTHAWYIGYAPVESPEIAVVVIVEGGGEGNAISLPVAGRMFGYYMSHR